MKDNKNFRSRTSKSLEQQKTAFVIGHQRQTLKEVKMQHYPNTNKKLLNEMHEPEKIPKFQTKIIGSHIDIVKILDIKSNIFDMMKKLEKNSTETTPTDFFKCHHKLKR